MSIPQFQVPMTIIYTHEDGTKDVFIRKEELGHGGFATVYRVTHKATKKDYAMKVISKSKYEGPKAKKRLEKLKNEILIQKSLNHPNIVRSYYAFSDAFNFYIVLEYCPGKTVRDLVKNSEKGYLSEAETRKILRDVVRGVVYLHDNHIIHRDLKLENYMIGADGRVKIADFGLSTILKNEDDKKYTICGTPNYLSPELLQGGHKGHSYEVDIWTIGVSAFAMLTGHPPFEGLRKKTTYENIKHNDYHFPPNIPISLAAKDFIRIILRTNPQSRPTAIDLANHPFLTTIDTEIVPPFPIPANENNDEVAEIPAKIKSPALYNNQNFNGNVNYNHVVNRPTPVSPRIPLPPKRYNYLDKIKNENENEELETPITTTHHKRVASYTSKNNRLKDLDVNFFSIPKYFVSRFCFHRHDLGYLLSDGTVGACFHDHSRIVIDPNEEFMQYYQNYGMLPDIINIHDFFEKEHEREGGFDEDDHNGLHRKVILVKRFAKSLKKTKSLFALSNEKYSPSIPLHNVKYFFTKDDATMFRLDNKDLQVNFSDHMKLIIFWNTKQICFVRSLNEKCNLRDLNDLLEPDANSDELNRFMVAKEMLSQLCKH